MMHHITIHNRVKPHALPSCRAVFTAPYMLWPCIRLSARLSHVGVLLKRINVGLREQRRTIATQGL